MNAGQDSLYGYYHDDDSAFQLVDTVKTQKQLFRTRKWQVITVLFVCVARQIVLYFSNKYITQTPCDIELFL